jgi:hypothetical protein
MNKALELLIAFQTRMLLNRNERGQGTLEYVGMTIVAAILVVAVLDVLDAIDLGEVFQTAVESVTGGE